MQYHVELICSGCLRIVALYEGDTASTNNEEIFSETIRLHRTDPLNRDCPYSLLPAAPEGVFPW